MTLTRDPEKHKAWRQRSKGLKRTAGPQRRTALKPRGTSQRARERRRSKEGPQWELCHRTACAACWGLERRRQDLPLDWAQLPLLEPGAVRSEGHHEPEALRLDSNTIPLGPSEAAGGCGHHEQRTRLGAARFWGWRLAKATGVWERVGGGLDMDPGEIVGEMRTRTG